MEKELVWAKMRGFPPWPGKICTSIPVAPKAKGKPSKWIFFFGSKNHSWMKETNIKPYVENRDNLVKNITSVALKEAVQRIDEYLSDPGKYKMNAGSDESPEFESPKPTKPVKTSARKSSTKRKSEARSKAKRASNNNDNFDESPNSKRKRYFPSDEPRIDSTSDGYLVLKEQPQTSMSISQSEKLQNIVASSKTIGFLGVGIMGSAIIKNLLNSGHEVIAWNRDPWKARKLEEIGAQVAMTPCDVGERADIIFSCVADPLASKEVLFGHCGIISSSQHFDGKGYIEITGLDGDTSQDIADAIISKGGRYLEAQVQGSRVQAENSTLIILAAGDRTLFDECESCFKAMGKSCFFLGDVGNASKMHLILQMITGVSLGVLAEALALADRAGLQQKDVLEVFELTTVASSYMIQKGKAIINHDYAPHDRLMHMQKDLRLALSLSEQIERSIPITAATNEVFKHAKRNGYAEDDASAVYAGATI